MNLKDLKHALKTGEEAHSQLQRLVEELAIDPSCSDNACGECAVCIAEKAFAETCEGNFKC